MFRDMADNDYIAARALYKAECYEQFCWCSCQCIEKYLKSILLINGYSIKHFQHRVVNLFDSVRQLSVLGNQLQFEDHIDDWVLHFERNGHPDVRYNQQSLCMSPLNDLMLLDKIVWNIRRYCQSFYFHQNNVLNKPISLAILNNVLLQMDHGKHNLGGILENELSKKHSVLKKSLIWNNLYFSNRKRNVVKMKTSFLAKNCFLQLHPELINFLKDYISIQHK